MLSSIHCTIGSIILRLYIYIYICVPLCVNLWVYRYELWCIWSLINMAQGHIFESSIEKRIGTSERYESGHKMSWRNFPSPLFLLKDWILQLLRFASFEKIWIYMDFRGKGFYIVLILSNLQQASILLNFSWFCFRTSNLACWYKIPNSFLLDFYKGFPPWPIPHLRESTSN